jgi:hypothetical protein
VRAQTWVLSLSLFVPSFHLLLGVLINEVCQVQFSSPFHPCLFLLSSISIPLWVWWVFHFAECTGQARTAAGRPTSKAGNDVLWTTTKHNFSPYLGIALVNNIRACLEHYAGYCTKDGTSQAAAPLVHRVYNAHALLPGHYTTLITTRLVDLIFWRDMEC